jgi:hypothetical protein
VGPPPTISSPVPYIIADDTTILTEPSITTNGATDYGTIYRGPTQDGPLSAWMFAGTSTFDTQSGLDEFFSSPDHLSLAALKFLALRLIGNPTISTGNGGPTKLALISVDDFTSGPPGGVLTFSGLDTLLLTTQEGSITLTSDLAFQDIATLYLYARGPGSNLTLDSSVSGTTNLFLVAEGTILASNSLTISGTGAGSSIFLLAGENIEIGGDLALSIEAGNPLSGEDAGITVNAGGDVNVGGAISIDGSVIAGGNLFAGGLVQVADLLSAGGSIFAPAVSATSLEAGSDITIDATGHEFGFGIAADSVTAGETLRLINAPSITYLHTSSDGSVGETPVDFNLTATSIVSSGATIPTLLFNGLDGTPNFANDNPGNGGHVTLSLMGAAGLTIGAGGAFAGVEANGGSFGADSTGGGNGGIVEITATGDIHLSDGNIFASSGRAPVEGPATLGSGGAVNLTSGGAITVDSTIEVSSDENDGKPQEPSRRSASGGNISLTSTRQTAGTAILINNTGQLRALLDQVAPGPGGKITILASGNGGSNVTVDGSAQADRGTVDIRHTGANGRVDLGANASGSASVTLRGDLVKAGALGDHGTLTIGRGLISADDTLKLYGASANGEVRFIDNVTIGGRNLTIISADTVTINNGKIVTVNGARADVYTGFQGEVPKANYSGFGGNGSTTGTFGGAGANNPRPIGQAPPFDGPPGG